MPIELPNICLTSSQRVCFIDAYNLTDLKGLALYYNEMVSFTQNYKSRLLTG